MASLLLYPATVKNVNGNTGIYREMEQIEYITNDYDTYGHWGNEDPGANYKDAIASVNGGKHKPSQIKGTNFANIRNLLPANAHVTGLSVDWAYAKYAYANHGHGSFGQPIISIENLGLHAAGTAPPRDVMTEYSVSWWNVNFRGEDLYDAAITFDLPMNTSNDPAYIKMKYLRLYIQYETANYIPSVGFDRNPIQYNGESTCTVTVVDTNSASGNDTVDVSVVVTSGLSIVPGSIDAQGTYNPSQQLWKAKMLNGKAKLVFKVTPSESSVSGNQNVNAYVWIPEEGKHHAAVESIYITPPKVYLLDCSVSTNELERSEGSNKHYTLFTLTVENHARTPVEVYLDFDGLLYEGNLPGYDANTKILTITSWDANDLYDIQLRVYGTETGTSQLICYSSAWTGVTRLKITTNHSEPYEEFYTELDAPLFTLGIMCETNGQEYVFGCLCRVTGTQSIVEGMKTVRASVINNGEKFTNKVTQIGDWQLLSVKFKYNESKKLSFRFYGNYVEEDRGKVEFGNLFVIHADHYFGYEYPALSFREPELLYRNDEYTNLLLEPPEKNPSTKHYFDLMDWMGLENNEYTIVHGLEVTGDISVEENVHLLMGFGHTGIEEIDYYKQSLNITKNDSTFKFGGKFETLGLNFPDITSLLENMVFYLQVDDAFDNKSPLNVEMKNVRVSLYYSLDNTCWDWKINGVSSKHYLLDLSADSEIPRGANYDVNKFQVDGADGEFPNRINLEENKLKLKFDTCECGTIEDLTILLEKVVEWLYPERDSLDNPILKTISFFYAPEVGYDYYIDEKMKAEPVDGAYECEVELIIPSGLARSLNPVESGEIGTTGHMGKVKPTILFNLTSHGGEIILLESRTNQKLTLVGTFIDELPINTLLKLDCKERKLYYEAYGEWFTIDPNNITLDSDFFTLAGGFDFSDSVNLKVSEVKYYELKG